MVATDFTSAPVAKPRQPKPLSRPQQAIAAMLQDGAAITLDGSPTMAEMRKRGVLLGIGGGRYILHPRHRIGPAGEVARSVDPGTLAAFARALAKRSALSGLMDGSGSVLTSARAGLVTLAAVAVPGPGGRKAQYRASVTGRALAAALGVNLR